jgi:hypothetical protein
LSSGLLAGIRIPPLEPGKATAAAFLKIAASDTLTYFSARAQVRATSHH